MANKNLHKAKKSKNDEFYTQLSDIENELKHYKTYFKDKVIFCNCDDPQTSDFWMYFQLNFNHFGLKKLIATHFEREKASYSLEMMKDGDIIKTPLKQNGDFRSSECIEFLKEADIVVTNPPFSMFREYITQLIEYKKKFVVIGNQNGISYQEIFPLLMNNKMWLGNASNKVMTFKVPDDYESIDGYVKVPAISWFTNLVPQCIYEDIILYKKYNSEEYPKYDTYNAINVDKVKDIPKDYSGYMGIPITFLGRFNPEQFEIMGQMATTTITDFNFGYPYINGIKKYARIIIRNKRLGEI